MDLSETGDHILIQIYDDGWRLRVQGHGLKDADLPASLLNQNCPKRSKHKSHGQINAVCWTAVTVALWGI